VPSNARGRYLTPRRRTIYELLVTGISRKDIAKRLGLSPHTVKNRTDEIYHIFDVHTQRELMQDYWKSYRSEEEGANTAKQCSL
jgi:DNA-binding NarL/FixJ family response regulator